MSSIKFYIGEKIRSVILVFRIVYLSSIVGVVNVELIFTIAIAVFPLTPALHVIYILPPPEVVVVGVLMMLDTTVPIELTAENVALFIAVWMPDEAPPVEAIAVANIVHPAVEKVGIVIWNTPVAELLDKLALTVGI